MSASTKKKLRKEENAAKLTEKQLAEQKEAKKLKGYTMTFVIVVCLVLVAAVAIMGVTAFNNSGILQRNTDAMTVGQHTLNNAELNYFYIDLVNEFYSTWTQQYGEYASMYMSLMGIDTTKPLNALPYAGGEEGYTYADYFKDQAIAKAANAYTLYDLAVQEGHTVSDDVKATYESNLAMMKMYSGIYGYGDFEEYLKALYGAGASEETYQQYLDMLALTDSFQTAKYDALSYDDAAITAYSNEHFNDFSAFDYCQFSVNVSDFLHNHEAVEGTHEHTEEENAAAEAAAKAAAETLAAGTYADAEALNNAINALDIYAGAETKKACTENKNVLFSNITNEKIAAWLTEEGRAAGDVAVIPNEYTSTIDGVETTRINGYYVVMFMNRENNNMNLVNVRHILAKFEGGQTDSATGVTTYSEEEKAAALRDINIVKDLWLGSGADEAAFTALVKDNSDDTGSKDNGGLYEDVYPGQMVEAFNDWCFGEREAGDYEIVETEYGYHLIYFVGESDTTFRSYMVENTLRNNEFDSWYEETTKAAVAKELNTKYLSLDMVLGNAQ